MGLVGIHGPDVVCCRTARHVGGPLTAAAEDFADFAHHHCEWRRPSGSLAIYRLDALSKAARELDAARSRSSVHPTIVGNSLHFCVGKMVGVPKAEISNVADARALDPRGCLGPVSEALCSAPMSAPVWTGAGASSLQQFAGRLTLPTAGVMRSACFAAR